MKNLIILVFLLINHLAFAQNKTIIIKCTQTADYCGGAAPSEEILEEMSKPKPLTNAVFYIVKGNKHTYKVYKKVVSNSLGEIKIILPKGTYSIFDENQIKKFVAKKNTDDYIWDNKCLLKMYLHPILIFKSGTEKIYKFNIHKKCFYSQDCGKFNGQMPS